MPTGPQSIEQKIDSLGKKVDFAKKIWILLSAIVALLFGAGFFYASTIDEYKSIKDNINIALEKSSKALSEIESLKVSIIPGVDASQVDTFTVKYPDVSKILGSNRFCALSRVQNNTHTNSNCECGLSQDAQGWVLTVQNNQTDVSCACDASCIK